jgi:hypothetical protein
MTRVLARRRQEGRKGDVIGGEGKEEDVKGEKKRRRVRKMIRRVRER